VLGSVSFAWLVATAKGVNLRQVGSGNLGATNVGRALGGTWFAVVFILDLAKGLGPTLAAGFLPPSGSESLVAWFPVLVGIAAVLGHVFPCFFGFKGGKAVATSLGVVIALAPVVAGILFGIWLISWLSGKFLFRMKSSSAVGPASMLAAAAAVPAQAVWTGGQLFQAAFLPSSILLILISLLILIRHRSNFMQMIGRAKPA
jgi:glycerol-3-phosphate acyltransferase PlsY